MIWRELRTGGLRRRLLALVVSDFFGKVGLLLGGGMWRELGFFLGLITG